MSSDIFDVFDESIENIINEVEDKEDFAEKWFIKYSKLEDIQKDIYEDESYNFVVKGCVGSGKTVLAIHKLFQLLRKKGETFNSYLFTVYAKALLKFICDGLKIYLKENEEDRNIFNVDLDKAPIINIDKLNSNDISTIKKIKSINNKEYLIIDEVQDLDILQLNKLLNKFENVMLFGDDEQQLYNTVENQKVYVNNIESIIKKQKGIDIKVYELKYTYRLPFEIADFAGSIIGTNIKEKCRKKTGINYKPNIIKCSTIYKELDFIINEIKEKDLKDVGIIVNKRENARIVVDYLKEKIDINYKINTNTDDLDFTIKDKPTILVYHSSKGTQFENVFIPMCDIENIYSKKFNYDKALYVACTRASKNLYITHSKPLTCFITDECKNKCSYYEYRRDKSGNLRLIPVNKK